MTSSSHSLARHLAAWLAVVVLALAFGLGEAPLQKIQEVRIAETAREMIASGDWLVPRYNGELRLQKPPLPYWAVAATFLTLGVSELAARLPALLCALLLGWLLLTETRKARSPSDGIVAMLVALSTLIGVRYARSGEADTMLVLCIATACLAGFNLLREGAARYRWAFFVALGLGFLTKGPAAIAIPLLTLFACAVSEKRLPALRFLSHPAGWALTLILGGAWYLVVYLSLPDAMAGFIGRQIDETYVGGTHAKAWWWYSAHLFDFFAPWSLFLPWMLVALIRRSWMPDPFSRFAITWFLVTFVLLHFTVNKQMQYGLLLLPPLSLVLADFLVHAGREHATADARLAAMLRLACLLAAGIVAWKLDPSLQHYALLFIAPLLLDLLRHLTGSGTTKSVPRSVPLLAGLALAGIVAANARGNLDADKHKYRTLATLPAVQTCQLPLLQIAPGSGAFSFYAGRVVTPVNAEELSANWPTSSTLVFADDDHQPPEGMRIAKAADASLWRVGSAKPVGCE